MSLVTDELKMIVELPAYGPLLGMVLSALSEDLRLLILVEQDDDNEVVYIKVRKR